jgi:hypothetical protein
VRGGCQEGVVSEKFVEIDQSPFFIGVFLFGFVEQAHFADVLFIIAVGEVALEVWVGQRIVVGQRDLVDVVRVNEIFLRRRSLLAVPPPHLNNFNKSSITHILFFNYHQAPLC